MADERGAGGIRRRIAGGGGKHQVPAAETESCIRILGPETLDEIAPVQVSGGFSRYQIISHRRSSSAKSLLSML